MGRMGKEPFITIRKSAVRYLYKIRRTIRFTVHAQAERKEGAKASTLSSVEIYSRMCSAAFSQVQLSPACGYTDKKENKIVLKYKEIQKGEVASHS
jgi:hypothetical protein